MRPVTVEHEVSQAFASMPTQGVVADYRPSSGVGYYVWLYGNYQPSGHAGMDFGCPIGTPIHAMASGTVLYAGWGYNLPGTGPVRAWLLYATFPGKVTVIQHPWGIGVYAHQSEFRVKKGDVVTEGQVIGLSGDTGGVAPHLHVEALVDLSYKTGGGLIYGRTDPSKFFGSGLAAQGTIEPVQEDDVSAQEVLSWKLERADGKDSTVAVELARMGPNLDKLDTVLAILNRMAPEVTEAMLNDRKQVGLLTELMKKQPSPAAIAAQIDAAGFAKEVLDALTKLLQSK